MALINCPECGREISDTSKMCIHCGYLLNNEEQASKKIRMEYITKSSGIIKQNC